MISNHYARRRFCPDQKNNLFGNIKVKIDVLHIGYAVTLKFLDLKRKFWILQQKIFNVVAVRVFNFNHNYVKPAAIIKIKMYFFQLVLLRLAGLNHPVLGIRLELWPDGTFNCNCLDILLGLVNIGVYTILK